MRAARCTHLTCAVLMAAACSSKASAPGGGAGTGSAEAAKHVDTTQVETPPAAPRSPRTIDLPAAGVTGLQVVSLAEESRSGTPRDRGLSVRWRAPRRAARIVCRVDNYNLVFFDSGRDIDGAAPDEHDMAYNPDPFAAQPTHCELRFDDEHGKPLAYACYRNDTLNEGECGGFPPPEIPRWPDGGLMGISVERASVEGVSDRTQELTTTMSVKALFTLIPDLPGRTASFALTCDGVPSVRSLDDEVVPISRLHAGETLYTWKLLFEMSRPLARSPKTCELRVTTTRPDDKTPKKLGTFCIAGGSTTPGPCPTR